MQEQEEEEEKEKGKKEEQEQGEENLLFPMMHKLSLPPFPLTSYLCILRFWSGLKPDFSSANIKAFNLYIMNININ